MPDGHDKAIYAAIIGTDSFLAARPVDPIQLSRACQAAGFALVVPVSLGEELIATHLARRVATTKGSTSVMSSCPLVEEHLRATPVLATIINTVSPPVACARYLRAAMRPRRVHVTYVGACPGAVAPEIDEQILPDVLLERFATSGVDLLTQPRHFDSQIPPERARYASTPGGAPAAEWLFAESGVRLIEAAPFTVDAVVRGNVDGGVLIDLASSCRCACARDRLGAARLEPPRSTSPVVAGLVVPVTDEEAPGNEAAPAEPVHAETSASPAAESEVRATFAENGLSAGEADLLPPLPQSLITAREPW